MGFYIYPDDPDFVFHFGLRNSLPTKRPEAPAQQASPWATTTPQPDCSVEAPQKPGAPAQPIAPPAKPGSAPLPQYTGSTQQAVLEANDLASHLHSALDDYFEDSTVKLPMWAVVYAVGILSHAVVEESYRAVEAATGQPRPPL